MREWIAFWNSANSIYVNARHRDVHYARIADEIRGHVPAPGAAVLDYGCGEALYADRIAAAAARLTLCDAAPAVREGLASRFAATPNIEVRAPDDIETMPDASFDLIVMNSVAQYLSPEELDRILNLFRRLLRPGGRLVLGDVLSPSVSTLADVVALLRFAAAKGFLLGAFGGLVRTALSDYRKLRSRVGLARYEEPAMLQKLAGAGFVATRAPANVGHNPRRMSFLASPK